MKKLKIELKIPKVVPEDWTPNDWNDVIYVIIQSIKGKKIEFEETEKPGQMQGVDTPEKGELEKDKG